MILNQATPTSVVNQPRGLVIVNGEVLQGVVSFEVDNNSYFQADTFRLVIALSAQPPSRDASYWSTQTSLQVELLAGYPDNPLNYTRTDLKSLLTGYVDDMEIDQLRDEIVFAGRDLTAMLIDTKPTVKYSQLGFQTVNGTYTELFSSEIATQIAKDVGLKSSVVKTPAITGTLVNTVRKTINDRGTYWDILTALAQLENYSVWVGGQTLHFEPRLSVNAGADVYMMKSQAPTAKTNYVANVCTMRFSRNLSVARGVTVTVSSFEQKSGKTVTATASRAHVRNRTTQGIGVTGLPPANYVRIISNANAAKCQQVANALLADISEKEMNLVADLPADDKLTPQTPIQVIGSGMAFDQIYYPQSIERRYSFDEGYRMTVRACNVSPDMGLV